MESECPFQNAMPARFASMGCKGKRIALDVTQTRFQSGSVDLAGRLVMPKGLRPVPIVVLVHGSEQFSARDFYALQRLFPSEGIGVFVYDKRGREPPAANIRTTTACSRKTPVSPLCVKRSDSPVRAPAGLAMTGPVKAAGLHRLLKLWRPWISSLSATGWRFLRSRKIARPSR